MRDPSLADINEVDNKQDFKNS